MRNLTGEIAEEKEEIAIDKVMKEKLVDCFTCLLCLNMLSQATAIVSCLHTFCRDCIYHKFEDEQTNCCPVCKVGLGVNPIQNLRSDNSLQDIILHFFPTKRSKNVRTTATSAREIEISISSLASLGRDKPSPSPVGILQERENRNSKGKRIEEKSYLVPVSLLQQSANNPLEKTDKRSSNGPKSSVQNSARTPILSKKQHDSNPARDSRKTDMLQPPNQSRLCGLLSKVHINVGSSTSSVSGEDSHVNQEALPIPPQTAIWENNTREKRNNSHGLLSTVGTKVGPSASFVSSNQEALHVPLQTENGEKKPREKINKVGTKVGASAGLVSGEHCHVNQEALHVPPQTENVENTPREKINNFRGLFSELGTNIGTSASFVSGEHCHVNQEALHVPQTEKGGKPPTGKINNFRGLSSTAGTKVGTSTSYVNGENCQVNHEDLHVPLQTSNGENKPKEKRTNFQDLNETPTPEQLETTSNRDSGANKDVRKGKRVIESTEERVVLTSDANVSRSAPQISLQPTEQRVATSTSNEVGNQPFKRLDPTWMNLIAFDDKRKRARLPQLAKPIICIKDRNVTVSSIIKYIKVKLNLDSESEIEISCCGQSVVPTATLDSLADIWVRSRIYSCLNKSDPKKFVMVLTYKRK